MSHIEEIGTKTFKKGMKMTSLIQDVEIPLVPQPPVYSPRAPPRYHLDVGCPLAWTIPICDLLPGLLAPVYLFHFIFTSYLSSLSSVLR